MTKTGRVTKRTLIASVLALSVSATMLIGTSYAWFTDSVASTGNIIKTGNLNIDLGIKTKTDNDYVSVKENPGKKAFDYVLWEPGYTEWVNAKVSTTGNLALKYTMTIVPNGEVSDLADVIDVYYVPAEVNKTGNRATDLANLNKLGTLRQAISGEIVINDTLIPAEDNKEDFATLALHMQETAGNEYQNMSIGTDFSLKILATQYTYESDSFDAQYDANAEYPPEPFAYNPDDPSQIFATPDDLHTAFEDGTNITLSGNVDLSGYEWEPVTGYFGTFDGAGFTVSGLTVDGGEDIGAMFDQPADGATFRNITFEDVNVRGKYAAVLVGDAETTNGLTIENIEIKSGNISANNYAASVVFDAEGDNVTMKDITNYVDVTSGFSASGIGAWVVSPTGTFDNLVNYGNVTGTNRAGGIFGNFGGTISNSENHGAVTATGEDNGYMPAGGIVAVASAATNFDHCINTGDVTTSANNINASAAGILGQQPSKAANINYCINTGNITAENSYAGGIATSLYGNTTSSYCYNSGTITGNNTKGNNPKYAAGGIAPRGAYGNGDKSTKCLNSGSVVANTNGAVCQLTYQNNGTSYYYDGGTLKTAAGAEVADIDAAVTALNSEASETFFVNDNGVIKPAALVG